VYHKSEEDLDRLLQVGEGLASIHQRASIPANYSDFMNGALPLPDAHHGLMAPLSWSGGPRHWKSTSPPSYPAQPTFLRHHLGRAGSGIGRARVLQATRLSPPFCASILIGRAQALEGHESSKLPGSAHLSAPSTWSGRPRHWKGTSPASYLAQPTFLGFQLGQSGSGTGRAQVLQATRLSPPFCPSNLVGRAWALEGYKSSKLPGSAHLSAFPTWSGRLEYWMGTESSKLPDPSPLFHATNPDNLSGLEPFQAGRTLDSKMTTSPA
jgi:hypothetical protein